MSILNVNMNNELFTSICNGDVKNSILLATKIIFLSDSEELLENVFIDVCSYIGHFINIRDISKLIHTYNDLYNIINSEKIIIKDIYILISKLCIICNIYNKHPTSKCTNMSLTLLKTKIAHIINNNELKLSTNGIIKFEGILPPYDNENYNTALKIISIYIKTIKSTDDISVDDANILSEISNNLRLVTEYILRKKIKLETKFNSTEDDIVWFIWGVFSILYKEPIFDYAYYLYNHNYKKKHKTTRSGLLHSLSLFAIYIHKKDISRGWTNEEKNAISKIDEISLKLYNEIRKDIIIEYPDKFEKNTREKVDYYDGLEYISNFTPEIDSSRETTTNMAYSLYPKSTSSKSVEGVNTNDNSRIILY